MGCGCLISAELSCGDGRGLPGAMCEQQCFSFAVCGSSAKYVLFIWVTQKLTLSKPGLCIQLTPALEECRAS